MKQRGFNLCKFVSGRLILEQKINLTEGESFESPVVKSLEVLWNTEQDEFWFEFTFVKSLSLMKCYILRISAKAFDPLGYVAQSIYHWSQDIISSVVQK